jgi:hypothetical protein
MCDAVVSGRGQENKFSRKSTVGLTGQNNSVRRLHARRASLPLVY